MTLTYLLDHTSIQIDRIFVESGYRSNRKSPTVKREVSRLRRLRLHLGLARVMRREYLFRALKLLTGIGQEDVMRWAARREWLLSLFFGVSIPEELHGRIRIVSVEEVAEQHGIPVTKTTSLNSETTVSAIAQEEPDIVLGLETSILSPDVLSIPSIGSLNGHSSLLPEYRGGATEFWQLVNGETETGVTIHWMVRDVDAGDICVQHQWPIPAGSDHHKLRLMSWFRRLEPWREVVTRIEAGDILKQPQGFSRGPTFRRPTLQMRYDFYCKGVRVAPRTVS